MKIIQISQLCGPPEVVLENGEKLQNVRSIEWVNRCGEAQILRLEIIFGQRPAVEIAAVDEVKP